MTHRSLPAEKAQMATRAYSIHLLRGVVDPQLAPFTAETPLGPVNTRRRTTYGGPMRPVEYLEVPVEAQPFAIDDRVSDDLDTGTVRDFTGDGRVIVAFDHPLNGEGPMVVEPDTLTRLED